MSWILNAYTLVFAAFMNPAGRLGDRYGHRRIFLGGVIVFTVGSAACGLSGSFMTLVLSREPFRRWAPRCSCRVRSHCCSRPSPLHDVPLAVSTWSAVGAMAAALGPPVGGMLVQLSWRWIFFVNVPVGLLAVVAGSMVLSKAAGTGTGVPDLLGALSLVVGVGALVWALIELPVVGHNATAIAVAAVGAGCAMALAVWRSLRHPSPAVDLAAVRIHADVVELPCAAGLFRRARRDATERRDAVDHGVGYAGCDCRPVSGAGPDRCRDRFTDDGRAADR